MDFSAWIGWGVVAAVFATLAVVAWRNGGQA